MTRDIDTASIEVLTAEVRTLVVGNRQVTLSVFKQLDRVGPEVIVPFGRVHSGERFYEHSGYGEREEIVDYIEVVGRVADGYAQAGSLVRARLKYPENIGWGDDPEEHQRRLGIYRVWRQLPLIVLAGLR